MPTGGNAEIVVESVAVQEAPADELAPFGVQVTGAPTFVLPFENCTVPDGPTAELLPDEIVAVSVTVPPATMLSGAAATAVVVAACVMVRASVFEVASAL